MLQEVNDIITKVNAILNIDVREKHQSREGFYPLGRQLVIYSAIKNLDYSLASAGAIFEKNPSTASHAKSKIEDYIDIDKGFAILFADVIHHTQKQTYKLDHPIMYPTGQIVICGNCKGEGYIKGMKNITFDRTIRPCEQCGGTGRLEKMTWYRRPVALTSISNVDRTILNRYWQGATITESRK